MVQGLWRNEQGQGDISEEVINCIDKRRDYPMPANITFRHREIIRLLCNGWQDLEIAETLHITKNTVRNHKTNILTSLNCRCVIELIHVALITRMITIEELCFRHSDIILSPLPEVFVKRWGK